MVIKEKSKDAIFEKGETMPLSKLSGVIDNKKKITAIFQSNSKISKIANCQETSNSSEI